jgi:hypothetical protein
VISARKLADHTGGFDELTKREVMAFLEGIKAFGGQQTIPKPITSITLAIASGNPVRRRGMKHSCQHETKAS